MKKLFAFALLALFSVSTWSATYTVAGSSTTILGSSWKEDDSHNDMTLSGATTYRLVKDGLSLSEEEKFEFKITKDHSWDTNYPGDNVSATIPVDTKSVIFHFKYYNDANEVSYLLGKCTVVGDEGAVNGSSWTNNTADNKMTTTDGVNFTLTVDNVSLMAKDYQFKIVEFGSWSEYYPLKANGGNASFTIAEAGTYKLVYSYNVKTDAITVTKTKKAEAPKFYITGDSALVVDAGLDKSKAWNATAIASKADSYTFKGLKANVSYQLKVVTTSSEWKGYSDLTGTPAAGLYTYNGGNICFRLSAAGDVVVNYTSSAFTLSGSFKAVEHMNVKFVPGIWSVDEPKYAAWIWGRNGYENWSPFFTGTGDTLSAQINADADSIIFVRCNPALTEPKWNNEEEKDNVYNEAEKTEIDKVGLTYTITGWGEGEDPKSTGTWKSVANYYVTGDSALVVDGGLTEDKEWAEDAFPSFKDTLVLKNLKANQEYKLKIVAGSAWKGYSDLTSLSSGLSVDGDNNIIFKLTAKGDVTVVYNSEVFKVLGSFVEPAFDPATQEHLKLVPYRWAQANAKMAVYTWGKKIEGKWSAFFTGEGDTLQTVIRQAADSMVLVRFNSDVTSPTWENEGENVWNKIDKILIDHKGLVYTIKNWDEGTWESYAPPVPVEKTVKLVPSEEWLDANAKFAAWTWGAEQEGTFSAFFTPISSGNDTLQAKILSSADSIAFVRFSPKATEPTWEKKGEYVVVWNEAKDTIDWEGLTATIKGWGELSWKPVDVPCSGYGLLVDGETYLDGKHDVSKTEWTEYYLRSVHLTKGQTLKIKNKCNTDTWVITKFAETSYILEIKEGSYVIDENGDYDFYIKLINENDEIYISKAGTYTTAVRPQCTDVMIQAFYNESYDEKAAGVSVCGKTRWWNFLNEKAEDGVTSLAEEMGHYFDLVWLPPSANGSGMGYHPKKYSDQNSTWGTKEELADLINTLHEAGSKVVADIVINHCEGWSSWCDFPELDFGEYKKFYPDQSYICKNDEVNSEWNKDKAGSCYGKASGSYDDGENWDGARDWSHNDVHVQEMFKAYLKWMRYVVGYDGFRYDKGDGFNNWHHDNYNKASGPYIAFMECYSNTDEIWRRICEANYNLMGLDFDTKWHVFDAFAGWDYNGKYGKARGDGLLGRNNGRYAVEFIDSHDWFGRGNGCEFGGDGNSLKPELLPRLLVANAFMLSMPGVPCVFYPHWAKYKNFIKPMIEARKLAGVHSESEVKDEYADENGYQATIVGKDGYLILCLGNKAHANFDGFTLMSSYYAVNDCGSGKDGSHEIWVKRTTPLPTSVESTSTEPAMKAEKFMKDGKMYIRLGDKVYDVIGQTIK